MKSKNFKILALNQLRGHWGAVIAALIVPSLAVTALSLLTSLPIQIYNMFAAGPYFFGDVNAGYVPAATAQEFLLSIPAFLGEIAVFVVSAATMYGISRYLLKFVRGGQPVIGEIFGGFTRGAETFGRAVLLQLLIAVFTALWSLLFVIPGIIAAYRYSMAFYIMADNDNISAADALNASKEMMRGHKWELFKLHLSFIGWIILCIITCGIGFIFLSPYMNAAQADFYEYLRGIRSAGAGYADARQTF